MSQTYGVIVGCDEAQEWLLPWWWSHYSQYNSYPVVFRDFGMSKKAASWCRERGDCSTLKDGSSALFKKPLALLESSFHYSLWLDLDCQVRGSLEPLFNTMAFGMDIGMVREDAVIHRLGREGGYLIDGEVNYNSGVVICRRRAPILEKWAEMGTQGRFLDDQYALARALYQNPVALFELPSLFNWPDDFGPNEQAIVRHFQGARGKLAILNQLLLQIGCGARIF